MKERITITLDTSVLLDILDHGRGSDFYKILDWHDQGRIEIAISNRVLDPDTQSMQNAQRQQLEELIEKHGIEIFSAPFRLNISRLGHGDALGWGETLRSPDEIIEFREIINAFQGTWSPPTRFRNTIGDYDALEGHFRKKRDFW